MEYDLLVLASDAGITGRVVERLLVVAFGGVSLILGWLLFVRGVDREQVAEMKAGSIVFNLRSVGPGAFFAIFGCVILVSSLVHTVEVTSALKEHSRHEGPSGDNGPEPESEPPPLTYGEFVTSTYTGLSEHDQARDLVVSMAIQTIDEVLEPAAAVLLDSDARLDLGEADLKRLAAARAALTHWKGHYLRMRFGERYLQYKRAERRDSSELEADERALLDELRPYVSETLPADFR